MDNPYLYANFIYELIISLKPQSRYILLTVINLTIMK